MFAGVCLLAGWLSSPANDVWRRGVMGTWTKVKCCAGWRTCVLEVRLLDSCSLLLGELFKCPEHLMLFNRFKIA